MNVPSYCSAAAGMFIVQRCVDATTFTYRSDGRELKVEITVDEVFEFERSPTHLPHLTRAGGVSGPQSLFTLFKFVSRTERKRERRETVATFANSLDASPVAPSLTDDGRISALLQRQRCV